MNARSLIVVLMVMAGCRARPAPEQAASPGPPTRPASPSAPAAAQVPWTRAFDLDGDGRNDEIEVRFTGGAHCCYRIGVRLTSTGQVIALPFDIDGGYVGGLDLSRPEHFDVRRTEGPLPELVMEIETYDGVPGRIDPAWRRKYGISTNHVAIGFAGGKLKARDLRR